MTDPAVAYVPNVDYPPYDRGKKANIWLKAENGTEFLGVVWPGKRTTLAPQLLSTHVLLKVSPSILVNNQTL